MGFFLTPAAFLIIFLLARRSLVAGLLGVLAVGYFYGITRANFLDTLTYFLFDSALLGLYAGLLTATNRNPVSPPAALLGKWVMVLVGWCMVLCLIPAQHLLIQLVGLRASAFLVPFLFLGGWLKDSEADRLTDGLAWLNLVALAFGLAEFVIGVPAFFPKNEVTEIIYKSNDVAGYTAFRIPSTFGHAHAYSGAMLMTIPWMFTGLVRRDLPSWQRVLRLAGLAAAVLGMLLSATRSGLVVLSVLVVVATFSGMLRGGNRLVWGLMLAGVGYLVSSEARFQRILSLADTESVAIRIQGSVNLSFVELLFTYPMGNGLGAGGTSIPAFLVPLLRDPVAMENEYSRILLELGLVGLCLWLAFFVWLLYRPGPGRSHPWRPTCLLMWWLFFISISTAAIGTGMMTAIPASVLMFLGMGFMVSRPPISSRRALRRKACGRERPAALTVSRAMYGPVHDGSRM